MPTAHQAGGTRDPQELYGRLRLALPTLPQDGANVVLVDDVLASGGHLRAAAAFLNDCGANVIAAVCAGRADHTEAGDIEPFKTRTDVLPDFVSDPDWLLPLVIDGVDM
jgi:adenine/guanine phosphoribosyltransferase-like PRPP-binding protein